MEEWGKEDTKIEGLLEGRELNIQGNRPTILLI